jgi:adenylate kinase
VGKTTVVEKLHAMLPGSRLANFGTVMLEEGKRMKWVANRDELRKLPVEKQRRLQTITAQSLSKMKDDILLVDTHLFIRTKEGFWPGLPYDVVMALKPTHLFLIEAKSEEILARRSADKTRYRDSVTKEDLDGELLLARSFLTVASTLTGAPMLLVANDEGKAETVAEGLADLIRGVVGS